MEPYETNSDATDMAPASEDFYAKMEPAAPTVDEDELLKSIALLSKSAPLVEQVIENPVVVETLAEQNVVPVPEIKKEWRIVSTIIRNPA